MSSSPYARDLSTILAALHTPEDEELPLPEEEVQTIHVYPVEGGGILLSPTPLQSNDEGEASPRVIDSEPPAPTPRDAPPLFLTFLLVLGLFLALDGLNSTLVALLTPTVTITLVPRAQQLTVMDTLPLGRVLSPLTISQTQSVPTTGRGHQDARAAHGVVTVYNGLATAQTLAGGTLLTGADGVQVITEDAVAVPPANPPSFGVASVSAHALLTGSHGNIAAGDINTIVASGLYVKNLTAFMGGQEARDFPVVTKADLDGITAALQARVTASMTAALEQQLPPGEQATRLPCHPIVSADHRVGEEAATLQVKVSETCTVIAYEQAPLLARAAQLLAHQARHLGSGYSQEGPVQVRVTRVTIHQAPAPVVLAFTAQGTWVYALTAATQQRLVHLVAGQPRREAVQLLSHLPGIARVTLSGLTDDEGLPLDTGHIHLLVVLVAW